MFRKIWFTTILALAASAFAARADGPSFDCRKAQTPDEKAICGNAHLSELDVLLDHGYHKLVTSLGQSVANKVHAPYMRARHRCGDDVLCIFQYGLSELSVMQAGEDMPSRPAWAKLSGNLSYDAIKEMIKVGECTVSTVREVATRLCSDGDGGVCAPEINSGSAIFLDNGMYGVSYDREPMIERSQYGDVVVACLEETPKDCPKGDDRGYMWKFTNQRTQGSVTLPDSEHSCGGA